MQTWPTLPYDLSLDTTPRNIRVRRRFTTARPAALYPLSTLTIRSEPSWSQLRVKCEKDRTLNSAIRESPTAVHKARPLFFHWLRQISQATKMCIIRCLRLPAALCAASAPAERMKQRWFSTGSARAHLRQSVSVSLDCDMIADTSFYSFPSDREITRLSVAPLHKWIH